MSITFKPLRDNVLIDYGDSNEEEKTKGGIIIAQESLEKLRTATNCGYVIKMGPLCYNDSDKFPTGQWCKEGVWVKRTSEPESGEGSTSMATSKYIALKRPVRTNVETFKANFDLSIEASGNYNLAFEFWVTEDSTSNQEQITNEVMIWTTNSQLQPAGEQIAVFFSDGYYYDLFRAEFNDWIYYAFVSQTDQQEGTLNVHNFINYMVATGYLNPNEYLASFELGNEIVNGSGQTNIRQYSISVNQTLSIFIDLNNNTTLGKFAVAPNPFNPKTTFKYHLYEKSLVRITIFDLNGSVVKDLFYGLQYPGLNTINWDGVDNIGTNVPSGVYFSHIRLEDRIITNKIMLLK